MAFTISDSNSNDIDLKSAKNAVIQSLNLDNLTTQNSTTGKIEEPIIVNNYIEASKSMLDTYGVRQEIVIQNSKEDPKISALRKLNDNCLPKETFEVEVLGDINYKVGYGVHVILPFIKDYDCFMYVKEVNNEWKSNGVFISNLTLTKSRVMHEEEWSDIDESESLTNGSSSSSTAKSIIDLLTQQIGKPYVWGAKGVDSFDCSGLMYYCYNQFQSQLVDSKPIGQTTYEQVKNGIAVDTNDPNRWQEGDLIFPHAGHVLAYIGDGKFIHAPKTGENVKITTKYWENTYAVRRVIAEDADGLSTDLGNVPSDYANGLNYVQSNCEAFISNLAYYNYKKLIVSVSKQYNIDPYLTAGIIAIESEGNPYAGADGKYRGLMQVENGTTDDEQTNISQGLSMFNDKKKAISGNQIHVLLSAYNSGEGTVKNACDRAGINESNCTIKQLGDALYEYCSIYPSLGDPNEKKYYASKVIKAYGILKGKNALE